VGANGAVRQRAIVAAVGVDGLAELLAEETEAFVPTEPPVRLHEAPEPARAAGGRIR
jgi:hypothetical protein